MLFNVFKTLTLVMDMYTKINELHNTRLHNMHSSLNYTIHNNTTCTRLAK